MFLAVPCAAKNFSDIFFKKNAENLWKRDAWCILLMTQNKK